MEKKRIVLIDDHVIVRNGLKELIEKLDDKKYEVIDQFDSGMAFLAALPALKNPELFIIDLNMPAMGGEELVEQLNNRGNTVPILILTLNSDEQTIIRLFRNKVRGYLTKDCSGDILKEALNSIFSTGYYHNEFLTLSLTNDTGKSQPTEQEKILEELTEREREFLKLVCHEDEYTYDQIASEMGIQPRTVDGHRQSIFEKFAIKSKTGLVLFVLKHQLFDRL